jgi:hypothetical protein
MAQGGQSHPKMPRERAESHFSKTAPPSTARDRAFEELEAIKVVQDQKTQRLREARLARDVQDPKKPRRP